MMNLKFYLVAVVTTMLLCLNNACVLLGNQKGYLFEMKNGENFSIGLNKTAIIKDVWEDDSFKDWYIKIKVVAIEDEEAQIQIYSPTFLGKDFNENRFVKIGESILIIQSEEMTTKIEINKISVDNVSFSLTAQSAPPAPELSESFSVEIN